MLMIVDPPVSFRVLKKGFNKVLDIGAAVEMPVGGLTTLTKTDETESPSSRNSRHSSRRKNH